MKTSKEIAPRISEENAGQPDCHRISKPDGLEEYKTDCHSLQDLNPGDLVISTFNDKEENGGYRVYESPEDSKIYGSYISDKELFPALILEKIESEIKGIPFLVKVATPTGIHIMNGIAAVKLA